MFERIRATFAPPPEPPPKSPEHRRLETLLSSIGQVHPELDTMPPGEQVALTRHLLAGLRRLRELRPDLTAEHDAVEAFAFGATGRVKTRVLAPVAIGPGLFDAGAVVWVPEKLARDLVAAGFLVFL